MSPRELLEVAGLVAFHAPSLLVETSRLNDEAIGSYWLASRYRLDRWGYALRAYGRATRGQTGDPAVRLAPLAEEIVACEVLTRCVAGICLAHDRLHHRHESAPLGKNILTGHREAIDRLHQVAGTWWSHESTSRHVLHAFVERCERWTDMLLGYLHSTCDVSEFAFDPPRMIDFSDDHSSAQSHGHELRCGNLLIVSLRAAFGDVGTDSPNGDLHSQIAGAALGCFGPRAFDSLGILRSTWLDRMQHTIEETDAMLVQEVAGPLRGPMRRA